ncbi:hypothetical protein V6U90_04565 [Micromonospora sp. CPCC 206060]|uniref:hypothetical protein n=1 Tax=Micromonospora sp. CPCC 206060 TaxID=3122406 RepID=UPI002FEEF725
MSEVRSGYPRRDAEGRIRVLGDLLGISLAGLVTGVLALVLFDAVLAFLGAGEFGRANGWLALILPGWLFLEEFRAWAFGAARVVAALVAAAVGLTGGLLAAGLAGGLPALASGALAATTCTMLYALIWFHGVRWLARRTG